MLRPFLLGRKSEPPGPAFFDYLTTQIDAGAVVPQGTDPDGLKVIIPSVSAGTSVIAETPKAILRELSVPTVPSVSGSTQLAYKLTYDGNGNDGGTAPTDATWYNHGTDAEVKDEGTLTLADHSFVNWNTEDDGSGTDYDPEDDITMNAPTTLFAQWVED